MEQEEEKEDPISQEEREQINEILHEIKEEKKDETRENSFGDMIISEPPTYMREI